MYECICIYTRTHTGIHIYILLALYAPHRMKCQHVRGSHSTESLSTEALCANRLPTSQGGRALRVQVQILRDLIDSTSAATRCVQVDEQALLERVSQVQIRQEVLYSSTRQDRVCLPQTLQLSVEDGNHIVQEACRRVRSKVCYVVSKRAAGGACLLHALSAEYA
jgi:hypothetical protein